MNQAPRKKVLILTYYWPPAGGPGVQRVLKFAKYLPDFGWEPIILTVKNGEYPAQDTSLLPEIPSEIKVFSTSTIEFFNLFKWLSGRKKAAPIETYILNRPKMGIKDSLFSWIRQNIFVPDARLGWIPFAVRRGLKIIAAEQPVLIFSSSPPHSMQLAAARLARESKLPWVADFRDPWTDAFWDKGLRRSAWATARNLKLEQHTIRNASAVTTVSQGVLDLLLKSPRTNTFILPNGYDATDFTIEKAPSTRFRIIYAGHIAASQNPENFFQAIAALYPTYGALLDIRFYGKVDETVRGAIQRAEVADIVSVLEYIPHNQLLKELINAEMLLLLIPRAHGQGVLTGKVFEYLGTRNFILGIGDETGDAAKLLEECQAGIMCAYSQDLAPIITRQIDLWQAGVTQQVRMDQVQQYERRALTRQLAQIFDAQCK